jgi:hypothetical protein
MVFRVWFLVFGVWDVGYLGVWVLRQIAVSGFHPEP